VILGSNLAGHQVWIENNTVLAKLQCPEKHNYFKALKSADGVIHNFEARRYLGLADDICNKLRLSFHSRNPQFGQSVDCNH
jgi:hypothetical protein